MTTVNTSNKFQVLQAGPVWPGHRARGSTATWGSGLAPRRCRWESEAQKEVKGALRPRPAEDRPTPRGKRGPAAPKPGALGLQAGSPAPSQGPLPCGGRGLKEPGERWPAGGAKRPRVAPKPAWPRAWEALPAAGGAQGGPAATPACTHPSRADPKHTSLFSFFFLEGYLKGKKSRFYQEKEEKDTPPFLLCCSNSPAGLAKGGCLHRVGLNWAGTGGGSC